MAEVGLETVQENLVQEMAKKGGEIPEKYILKDGFPEAIDGPAELWRRVLLIDFARFSSSTPDAEAELAKLRSALSEWGCFLAINHGIERSFIEEMIQVTKQFFALPVEEKLKSSAANNEVLEGYRGDPALRLWSDRLLLSSILPEEKRNLQFWPQKPELFRKLVDEYSRKLETVKEKLYKAMARSLNLEEDCFLNHQGRRGPLTIRFNFFPRCPCPDRVLGGRPHSDGATITFILADNEGLQIEKDDIWYKVPVIPSAMFVNIGDMGEVMSNGIFKSMVHRVVTNPTNERVSVASFFDSEVENEIGPLSELISDKQPRVFKNFKYFDYKQGVYDALSKGIRPLDALRV